VARASYSSASSEQFTRYMRHHGQVQVRCDLCWSRANCWGVRICSWTGPSYVPMRNLCSYAKGCSTRAIFLCASSRHRLSSPTDSATIVLLPGYRKGFFYVQERRAQLTQSVDHQRSHSLHLDNLHSDARTKRRTSHVDSSTF